MNLYEQIFRRKSCRKYQVEPLSAPKLQEIEDFISGMQPLLSDVSIRHRIMGPKEVKGMLAPKAPHFAVISGKPQPYRDLCAGFLFQQLDLYLSAQGLGSCWLGVTKGREKSADETDILSICFGNPAGELTRMPTEFKRKSLSEISIGEDPRVEAARLAPSGRNIQPWYFIVADGMIHAYKEIPGKLWGKLYNLEELDLGIALSHLALASEAMGKPFQFEPKRQNAPPAPGGFVYAGTVV